METRDAVAVATTTTPGDDLFAHLFASARRALLKQHAPPSSGRDHPAVPSSLESHRDHAKQRSVISNSSTYPDSITKVGFGCSFTTDVVPADGSDAGVAAQEEMGELFSDRGLGVGEADDQGYTFALRAVVASAATPGFSWSNSSIDGSNRARIVEDMMEVMPTLSSVLGSGVRRVCPLCVCCTPGAVLVLLWRLLVARWIYKIDGDQ